MPHTHSLCSIKMLVYVLIALLMSEVIENVEFVRVAVNSIPYVGGSASLVCVSRSMPKSVTPTMTWKRDGSHFLNSTKFKNTTTESKTTGDERITTSYLHILELTVNDSGMFTCMVTNSGSDYKHSLNLTVGKLWWFVYFKITYT